MATSITIADLTIRRLTSQPFGYDDADARAGLAAQRWAVEALLRPAEWLQLTTIYEDWRALRGQDPPTMASLAVGTTVAFSAELWGRTWSAVPVWFASTPSGAPAGAFIAASFEVVDAAQALAVLLAQEEKGRLEGEASDPDYGTYELAGVELTLLADSDDYDDIPQLSLGAAGTSVLQGPTAVSKLKRLRGWTEDPTAWEAIKDWFEAAVETRPVAGDWFPISKPTLERQELISGGIRVSRLVIELELKEIR